MLGLIHNLRFDRTEKKSQYSFKKSLENSNTSDLAHDYSNLNLSNRYLSSNWLSLYRKQ